MTTGADPFTTGAHSFATGTHVCTAEPDSFIIAPTAFTTDTYPFNTRADFFTTGADNCSVDTGAAAGRFRATIAGDETIGVASGSRGTSRRVPAFHNFIVLQFDSTFRVLFCTKEAACVRASTTLNY